MALVVALAGNLAWGWWSVYRTHHAVQQLSREEAARQQRVTAARDQCRASALNEVASRVKGSMRVIISQWASEATDDSGAPIVRVSGRVDALAPDSSFLESPNDIDFFYGCTTFRYDPAGHSWTWSSFGVDKQGTPAGYTSGLLCSDPRCEFEVVGTRPAD